jgi:5-bromo-4-chloroindolyl phosphate hydrolysis protein
MSALHGPVFPWSLVLIVVLFFTTFLLLSWFPVPILVSMVITAAGIALNEVCFEYEQESGFP